MPLKKCQGLCGINSIQMPGFLIYQHPFTEKGFHKRKYEIKSKILTIKHAILTLEDLTKVTLSLK